MPERHVPTPDDRRPERPDLQTSNDDFLDDLGERLENKPLTPKEQAGLRDANRIRAGQAEDRPLSWAEPHEQTLDKLDLMMGEIVKHDQWKKLDSDSRKVFEMTRGLYTSIGKRLLAKQGSENMVTLANQARECWNEFNQQYDAYASGQTKPTEFIDALNEAFRTLQEIDEQVSHLQDK